VCVTQGDSMEKLPIVEPAKLERFGFDALALQRRLEPQPVQDFDRVGTHLYGGTHFAQRWRLLVHANTMATPDQARSSGQAANASANDCDLHLLVEC